MSNAVRKEQKIYIPARNKSIIARPRPAIGKSSSHADQVRIASEFCFKDHKKTYDLLAKM